MEKQNINNKDLKDINFKNNEDLRMLIHILKKKVKTEQEIDILSEGFREIEFFKNLKNELSADLMFKLFKNIKIQKFKKRQIVYYEGEHENKFHFVISGKFHQYRIKRQHLDENLQTSNSQKQEKEGKEKDANNKKQQNQNDQKEGFDDQDQFESDFKAETRLKQKLIEQMVKKQQSREEKFIFNYSKNKDEKQSMNNNANNTTIDSGRMMNQSQNQTNIISKLDTQQDTGFQKDPYHELVMKKFEENFLRKDDIKGFLKLKRDIQLDHESQMAYKDQKKYTTLKQKQECVKKKLEKIKQDRKNMSSLNTDSLTIQNGINQKNLQNQKEEEDKDEDRLSDFNPAELDQLKQIKTLNNSNNILLKRYEWKKRLKRLTEDQLSNVKISNNNKHLNKEATSLVKISNNNKSSYKEDENNKNIQDNNNNNKNELIVPKNQQSSNASKKILKKNYQSIQQRHAQDEIDSQESFSENDENYVNKQNDVLGDDFYNNEQFIKQFFSLCYLIKTCNPGDQFGEMSLKYRIKSPYTCICLEEGWVGYLNRRSFDEILLNYYKNKLTQNLQFMQQLPMFQGLSQPEIEQIYNICDEKEYTLGQYIFKEQDEDKCIYIIRKGIIEIAISEDGTSFQKKYDLEFLKQIQTPKRYKLAKLGEGEMFGDQEILDKTYKRTNCAKCVSHSALVYVIEKEKVNLLLEIKALSNNIFNINSEKQIWRDQRIKAMKNAKEKQEKIFQYLIRKKQKKLNKNSLELNILESLDEELFSSSENLQEKEKNYEELQNEYMLKKYEAVFQHQKTFTRNISPQIIKQSLDQQQTQTEARTSVKFVTQTTQENFYTTTIKKNSQQQINIIPITPKINDLQRKEIYDQRNIQSENNQRLLPGGLLKVKQNDKITSESTQIQQKQNYYSIHCTPTNGSNSIQYPSTNAQTRHQSIDQSDFQDLNNKKENNFPQVKIFGYSYYKNQLNKLQIIKFDNKNKNNNKNNHKITENNSPKTNKNGEIIRKLKNRYMHNQSIDVNDLSQQQQKVQKNQIKKIQNLSLMESPIKTQQRKMRVTSYYIEPEQKIKEDMNFQDKILHCPQRQIQLVSQNYSRINQNDKMFNINQSYEQTNKPNLEIFDDKYAENLQKREYLLNKFDKNDFQYNCLNKNVDKEQQNKDLLQLYFDFLDGFNNQDLLNRGEYKAEKLRFKTHNAQMIQSRAHKILESLKRKYEALDMKIDGQQKKLMFTPKVRQKRQQYQSNDSNIQDQSIQVSVNGQEKDKDQDIIRVLETQFNFYTLQNQDN